MILERSNKDMSTLAIERWAYDSGAKMNICWILKVLLLDFM